MLEAGNQGPQKTIVFDVAAHAIYHEIKVPGSKETGRLDTILVVNQYMAKSFTFILLKRLMR